MLNFYALSGKKIFLHFFLELMNKNVNINVVNNNKNNKQWKI